VSTPSLIRSVAVAVGLVWTLVLYTSGIHLPSAGKQVVANLPTASLVLALAFDLWLWKVPGAYRIHGRPRVFGTWTTTITPHPDSRIPDEADGGPRQATTFIEQTFWTLSIRVRTVESESISRAESLVRDGSSKQRRVLTYMYTNTPQLAVRHRSPIHVGAANLSVEGDRPDTLSGTYWTDRLTVGDLHLSRQQ
jgi:hypothetical protein